VVSVAGTYGGFPFQADRYSCQRCPDPNMDMASDRCGSCDEASGYSPAPYGVAEIGALACVYATHASYVEGAFNPTGTSAYEVTYRQVQTSPEDATRGGGGGGEEEVVGESLTLKHYFVNATAQCYFYRGPESNPNCQTLANLCVLQLYDPTSSACLAYAELENLRQVGSYPVGNPGWRRKLPWLHYDGTAESVRNDAEGIGMVLSLSNEAVLAGKAHAANLTFFLSVTALNGTWLGLQELDTQFFYCAASAPNTGQGGGSSRSTAWRKFGNGFHEKFKCDLQGLMDKGDPLFYEPFLRDEASGDLYPVPVLLRDYVDADGELVNWNNGETDEDGNVFVRRFTLFDTVSGVSTGYTSGWPKIVRYASSIKLKVASHRDKASKILPPILEVAYTARHPKNGQWDEGMRMDWVEVSVEYSMDRTDYLDTVYGFFSTFCVLAGLAFFVRWQNWYYRNFRVVSANRRLAGGDAGGGGGANGNDPEEARAMMSMGATAGSTFAGSSPGYELSMRGRECSSLHYLLRSQQWAALILCAHSWAAFNFVFVFSLCTCFFVFFKMQSESDPAFLLLPPQTGYFDEGDDYYFIWVLIYTMAMSQTAFVCHLVYLQCCADVFFVDMENGGGGSGLAGGSAFSPSNFPGSPPKPGREPAHGVGGVGGGGAQQADPLGDGVSGWRRIFLANEWKRLQGTRRTSLEVSLFGMAFCLLGHDLQYLATPQPDLDNHAADSCGASGAQGLDLILRFASTTWWFVLFEVAQLLLQASRAYLSCVGLEAEPLGQQFVDLCTAAKVSVLLLDDTYHGYVLYCDSSADSADTSMRHLTRQLLVEMKSGHLAGRRGPTHLSDRPGFEEVQAFELYVSDGWLKWYRGLRNRLDSLSRRHAPGGLANMAGQQQNSRGGADPVVPGGGRGSSRRRRGPCGAALLGSSLEERHGVLAVGGLEVLNDKLRKFFRRQYRGDLEWEAVPAPEGPLGWFWLLMRTVPAEIKESRLENVLVPDTLNRFTSVTFYGIEFELWLRDVLTFALCDIWFKDTATSIVVTYVTYQVLRAARVHFGSANMAHSSLVDKTFLF
jgi:meckelin